MPSIATSATPYTVQQTASKKTSKITQTICSKQHPKLAPAEPNFKSKKIPYLQLYKDSEIHCWDNRQGEVQFQPQYLELNLIIQSSLLLSISKYQKAHHSN